MTTVDILVGDCRQHLADLPAGSVQCCVTSPPYFWARDYAHVDQIGHEESLPAYVETLGDVFDEVKRIISDDGVLWLNLGDSYYSGNGQPCGSDPRSSSRNFMREKLRPLDVSGWDIPKKSLCGVPWLVAFELQKRGWTLRSDTIWNRQTALSEPSVRDRPHRQHEYLFLLSKSRRYFFNRAGLNCEESVWTIPHERGMRGHNAAFPRALASRCIMSGSRAGDMILDPFGGSGTTAVVSSELGRNATICELNPAYAALAEQRIRDDGGMFVNIRTHLQAA